MTRDEQIHFQSMAKVAVDILANKLKVEDVVTVTKELMKHIPKVPAGATELRIGGGSSRGGYQKKAPITDGVLQFGKHSGKHVSEIPQDYIEFLLKSDRMGEDVKSAIREASKTKKPAAAKKPTKVEAQEDDLEF